MKKKVIAGALCAALLITGLFAYAANSKQITATVDYDINVTYDGVTKKLTDANGKQVYPIVYEGTTYLPVRAVAGLVGTEVNWDQSTRTVQLGRTLDKTGDWQDTTVTLGGRSVQLFGKTLQDIIDMGYTVDSRYLEQSPGANAYAVTSVPCEKGSQYFGIFVYNNANMERSLAECLVAGITCGSSAKGADFVTMPHGLYVGMEGAKAVAAVPGCEVTYEGKYSTTYRCTDSYTKYYEFTVWKETGKVNNVTLKFIDDYN